MRYRKATKQNSKKIYKFSVNSCYGTPFFVASQFTGKPLFHTQTAIRVSGVRMFVKQLRSRKLRQLALIVRMSSESGVNV